MVIKINGNIGMELKSGFHLFPCTKMNVFHMLHKTHSPECRRKNLFIHIWSSRIDEKLCSICENVMCFLFVSRLLFLWVIPLLTPPKFSMMLPHYSCIDHSFSIHASRKKNEYTEKKSTQTCRRLNEKWKKNAKAMQKKAFNLKSLQY